MSCPVTSIYISLFLISVITLITVFLYLPRRIVVIGMDKHFNPGQNWESDSGWEDEQNQPKENENDQMKEEEEEEEVVHVLTLLDHLAIELRPINLPLMTFCKALDVALHGGFEMNMMTELYGDKGIGKTTFCLQLCLNVQIPESVEGHAAESIYIDTEGSFCIKRMKVMARKFASRCRAATPDFKLSVKELLRAVHVVSCGSVRELEKTLDSLHTYLKTRKVKLIVLDSIAFVFYACTDDFEGRVKSMYSVCQKLNSLMAKFNLAVVVTNNMTTRFHENGRKYYIPYLGESWTHIPHQRVELIRSGKLRQANIAKCYMDYKTPTYYKVTSHGIRD